MRNEAILSPIDEPVIVQTEGGRAVFHRLGPTSAVLKVAYRVPGMEVETPDGDVRLGVESLCAAEIATVRETLSRLGEELSARLPRSGTSARVRRRYRDEDEKEWCDHGTSFAVAGSVYRGRETISTEECVSDAQLVRDTLGLWIEQRQRSLQTLYRQVLLDAEAARAARANCQTDPVDLPSRPDGVRGKATR
jgi:hypothetical protein